MRTLFAAVLLALPGTLLADEFDHPEDRFSEEADATSALLTYSFDFGGKVARTHGFALRVQAPDMEEESSALLEGRFGAAGLQQLTFSGYDLVKPDPYAQQAPQAPRKGGYLSRITGVQWLGIGVAVVALGAIAAGGGGGGDGEPAVSGTGGS